MHIESAYIVQAALVCLRTHHFPYLARQHFVVSISKHVTRVSIDAIHKS